jgi:hypothetical protein
VITFKDYYWGKVKAARSATQALPSPNALEKDIVNQLTASPIVRISNTEASVFSNKVSELTISAEVINELSDKVGAPMDHETEDEFVDRAKLTLKNILKIKLSR